MPEEQQEQIRAANEQVRSQRQGAVDVIASKFAQFKRDFIGAPIRRALLALQAGQTNGIDCEIPYRKNEKYWLTSSNTGEVSFYHSFNFSNSVDISMARICLMEFKEASRHVTNNVGV